MGFWLVSNCPLFASRFSLYLYALDIAIVDGQIVELAQATQTAMTVVQAPVTDLVPVLIRS